MLGESLLPDVQVTLEWAARRRWRPGDAILGSSPATAGLFLVTDGALRVEMCGGDWRVPAGSVMLLPAAARRDRIAAAGGDAGAGWLSLGIRARLYGRLPVEERFAAPRVWEPSPETWGRLCAWAEEIVAQWEVVPTPGRPSLAPPNRPKSPAARALSDGLARAVFVLCWQEARPEPEAAGAAAGAAGTAAAPGWLIALLRRTAAAPEMSTAALCEAAGVSPAHLRRTFHRYVGVSPQAYLTDRRLDAARELLRTTDLTVAAVAERVGFDSAPYFTRLFAARFGVPPARFRHETRSPGV